MLIDGLFRAWQDDHCRRAYEDEIFSRHLPRVYRA